MIKIYVNKEQSRSVIKVREWLVFNHLPYEELGKKSVTQKDLKHILTLTTRGFDEIMISKTKSPLLYSQLGVNMDELIIDEMLSLIMRNQKLLKTPIIFDETDLSVGFNIRRLHDFIQK